MKRHSNHCVTHTQNGLKSSKVSAWTIDWFTFTLHGHGFGINVTQGCVLLYQRRWFCRQWWCLRPFDGNKLAFRW